MRNRDKAYLGSAADISEHNEKPAIRDDSYGLNGETPISQDRQLNQQIDKVLCKPPIALSTGHAYLAAPPLWSTRGPTLTCAPPSGVRL